MKVRPKHPRKEIEAAVRYAESQGWRGNRFCRCGEFCITSIWSTPKNSVSHARALRRVVENCSLREEGGCA